MKIKIELDNPKLLKSILEAIPTNISEGIMIDLNEQGFNLQVTLAGMVWAIEANIAKDKFSIFEIEDSYICQLNLKEFTDFIKTAAASDTLVIELSEKKESLELILQKKNMIRQMNLRLLNVQEDYRFRNLVNATTKFEGSFTINSSLFSEVIKTIELAGTHVSILMNKEKIIFKSEGTSKSVNVEIDMDNEEISNFKFDGDKATSLFGIEYLSNITKFSKIQDHFLICMGENKPILTIFKFDDDAGYVAIAIAQRSA
jgi:proliferating cell nuclear antigen PCNA